MVKRPPTGKPREFVTAKAIGFAVCCYSGKQVEKVLDDLDTSR